MKIKVFITIYCIVIVNLLIIFTSRVSTKEFDRIVYIDILTSKAYVNDKIRPIDEENSKVNLILKNGRTWVPIRFVSEAFDAKVYWNPRDRTINVNYDKTEVKMKVNSKEISINNKAYFLDEEIEIINGRAYLPLRFFAENVLQMDVFYKDQIIAIGNTENINDIRNEVYYIYKYMSLIRNFDDNPLFPIDHFPNMGFVDIEGNIVIEPKFVAVSNFNEGLARVLDKETKLYGYINKKGEYVIEPQFYAATDFREGLALVRTDERDLTKKYFINYKGEKVNIPTRGVYDNFKEGLVSIYGEGINNFDKGIMDKTGELFVSAKYENVSEYNEGMAAVSLNDGYSGFVNLNGELVIDTTTYYGVSKFSNGLAAVKTDDKCDNSWGYINKKGELVIKPKFQRAEAFSNGLALVKENDKYGYIDTNGDYVIEPQFINARSFSDNLAEVQSDNYKWGYINKEGEIAITTKFRKTNPFKNGLAFIVYMEEDVMPEEYYLKVTDKFFSGYINKNGEVVWKRHIMGEYDLEI